jgi:hypothetical protein
MKKTKTYAYGHANYKCYFQPVGKGWEVAVTYSNKPLFVGNFVHLADAKNWWTTMNRELVHFGKEYTVDYSWPIPKFNKSLSAYLAKCYYSFLDEVFAKYSEKYNREFASNVRSFKPTPSRHEPDYYFKVA